jgi:hypothetical protein
VTALRRERPRNSRRAIGPAPQLPAERDFGARTDEATILVGTKPVALTGTQFHWKE